ncbi:MAG: hypothetical protein PHN88_14730 [Ignavibacteria bacterium]|nr:hypothetical protein [Ignavibacteria bacterium]
MAVKWIRMYNSAKVNPVHLKPEDVNISNIAHSLSIINRFTGQSRFAYSVGLHSILVASFCSKKNKLWGLLHDAPESFINDLASPVKNQKEMKPYRNVERHIKNVIAYVFGLPKRIPDEVIEIDHRIVQDEGKYLFTKWDLPKGHKPLIKYVPYLLPDEVENMFINTFNVIIGGL